MNSSKRRVFTQKSAKRKKSIFRQSLECSIILVSGFYILLLLNTIPNRDQWGEYTIQVWELSVIILSKLIDLSLLIGTGLLTILAIIIGIGLILGGVIRLIKIVGILKTSYK